MTYALVIFAFVDVRMKPLRLQLRGLIVKLTLFYVLLSLPCLLLIDSAVLTFEFRDFMAGVEAGALTRATTAAAQDLGEWWPVSQPGEARQLTTWAQALILRLQRPHGELVHDASFILLELAAEPLAAAVLDTQGRVLAQAPAPPKADWAADIPPPGAPEYRQTSGGGAVSLPGAESPYRVHRVLAPVANPDGSLRGYLFVELRLPVPWHRFLLDMTLEWPIVIGYLLVFGIASSFFLAHWVTRRLNRVARAAGAWSRGDFSDLIDDPSRDELGRLSALLDRMALELKALMRSRAQLAMMAERQRLARDLHDTVKQKAFALSMQLATARRQLGEHPASSRVEQAERLSQQIQQELVQVLDGLRATDAELPFGERLRARAAEWTQLSAVPLLLELDLAPLPPLAAPIEEALLRIADEALANVVRHSAASMVRVDMRQAGGRIELAIGDNGHGAPVDAPGGMGLVNMRERAEALPGGRFAYVRDASGARVTASFSFEHGL